MGTVTSGARTLAPALLEQRTLQAAGGFAALGIGAGDAVALMLRNDIAFIEATLAAGRLGAYPVPVNWHLKAAEAGYVIRDCGAKALVVHADLLPALGDLPAGLAVLVAATPPEIQAAYAVAARQAAVPAGRTDWERWLADAPPSTARAVAAPSSIIYTSGTTGRPKGVRRLPPTPEQQAMSLAMRRRVFGITETMRTVITGPMYHSAPNTYALHAVRNGGTAILQPRFDAEDLLATIERERISHLHMVPTMFVRLLRLPAATRRRYDLGSLQFVVHAAAPCPPEAKRAMIDWWGPVINEYYGATETGAVVFCTSEEWLARPGTVGRLIENAEVAVLDEQGRAVPAGQVGEIYCRNRAYADFTYLNRHEERVAMERRGLWSVGDLGHFDAEGWLFLSDRKRDMVISGGVNIYPAEIEHVLVGAPGVRDCAVFGIPDAEYGEALMAVVELLPGAARDEAGLRAHLRARLAGYKVPKLIDFAEHLPREDSGKIFKRRLREPFWRDAGRLI